ncbi:MAG: FxLYD domain-containing protein [archaeon]
MGKSSIFLITFAIILVIAFSGCTSDEEPVPVSNVTPHFDRSCPVSCDDSDACTEDVCSADTGYNCVARVIIPCCGDGICEGDETPYDCSDDCGEVNVDCENLTCLNKCIGNTYYRDGLCNINSGLCEYQVDKSSPTCGYVPLEYEADGSAMLYEHRQFNESNGYMHVVGLVKNDGKVNIKDIKLTIRLYKVNDVLLESHTIYAMHSVLEPDALSPFRLTLLQNDDYDHYDVSITSFVKTLTSPRGTISFYDDRAREDDGYYYVEGNVTNNGDGEEDNIKIIVAIYDEVGKILYAEKITPTPTRLSPNANATFQSASRLSMLPEGIDMYRVWVE